MNYYLGIDIGTSGCKCAVFNQDGRLCSDGINEYQILCDQTGHAELDTNDVISKCLSLIKQSVKILPDCDSLGIGISSQGEAFTLLDQYGNAISNALISSDTRAKSIMAPWINKFGEERLYRITGHTPHTMFSLFKLLWIKKYNPEVWSNAVKIMCFEDLLQFRLGLKNPSMGWSLAGRTMLFDVNKHEWSEEVLNSVGIKKSMLAEPKSSGSLAGIIPDHICYSLGLPQKTFIVTGGHDQPCAALGAGAIENGMAAYASGSVECVTPTFKKPVFSKELKNSNLCTYDHVIPGLYTTVAFSLTGGNLLKWFRQVFYSFEASADINNVSYSYESILSNIPEKPTKIYVLPYFTPSGTPYFDLEEKGSIIGLSLSTNKYEILKALLEGIALEIKLNLEILKTAGYEISELRTIGGGACSSILNQLKADVTGMPITVLDVSEAGCLGVAMLAASRDTQIDIKEIVKIWVKPIKKLKPRRVQNQLYEKKFIKYKGLYHYISEFY